MADFVTDLTPRMKAARVAWALCSGERLTLGEVAKSLSINRSSEHRILTELAIVLPIVDINHRWQRMPKGVDDVKSLRIVVDGPGAD